MKYTVKGFGEVSLTDKNFLAKGGEGSVYVKGNTAYKIFEKPSSILEAKLQELSVLDIPQIVKPENLILDKKNKVVGYTMQYVKDTTPLVRMFTKTFKQKNNITPENSISLVQKLQDIISYVHSKNILVVDLNEMNFLANKKFDDIYAIDVNSYQTRHFPAQVIMPSVRDWHTKDFDVDSDWFSWAVITFQLLIGIHPYKGKHPDFKNIALSDRMEARMLKNVSVFNSQTTMPKVCNPFDVIPASLKQWYEAVFETGYRGGPPMDYEAIAQVITKIRAITGSNLFIIDLLEDYKDDIVDVFTSGSNRVVQTQKGLKYNKKEFPIKNAKVGFTPKMDWPIAAYLDGEDAKLYDLRNNQELEFNLHGEAILENGGRIYVKNGTNMVEIIFTEIGTKIIPAIKQVGHFMDIPGATKTFDGVVFQNMLGRFVVSIFPDSGKHFQIKLPELDEYRIIDAKYQNNVLGIVGMNNGKYDRFVIRFSSDHSKYDLRKVEDVSYTGINFTVADHGVCVWMNEDEKIEAFSNVRNVSQVKVLDDPTIGGDMILFHNGSKILAAQGSKLYSLTMK